MFLQLFNSFHFNITGYLRQAMYSVHCTQAKNQMKHNWRQLAVIVALGIVNVGIIDKSKTEHANINNAKIRENVKPFFFQQKMRTVFILEFAYYLLQ